MGFLYVCEGVVLAYLTGFVLRSGLCLDIVSVQLPSTGSGFTDRISSFLHFLLETAEVEPLELLKNCVHAGLDVLSVCLAYILSLYEIPLLAMPLAASVALLPIQLSR